MRLLVLKLTLLGSPKPLRSKGFMSNRVPVIHSYSHNVNFQEWKRKVKKRKNKGKVAICELGITFKWCVVAKRAKLSSCTFVINGFTYFSHYLYNNNVK